MDTICPACGEGILTQHHDINTIEYPNETIELKFFYSVCSECGSELASPDQVKINKLIHEIALMQRDGVLNEDDFRSVLDSCIKITTKS